MTCHIIKDIVKKTVIEYENTRNRLDSKETRESRYIQFPTNLCNQ